MCCVCCAWFGFGSVVGHSTLSESTNEIEGCVVVPTLVGHEETFIPDKEYLGH